MVGFSYETLITLVAGNLNTYIFGGGGWILGMFIVSIFVLMLYRMGAGLDILLVFMTPLIGTMVGFSLLPEGLNVIGALITGVIVFIAVIQVVRAQP